MVIKLIRTASARTMIRVFLSVLCLAGFSAQSQAADDSASLKDFAPGGSKTCLMCHNNDNVKGILETPHFNENDPHAPAAQQDCQSCHGPSAEHVKNPMANKPLQFGPDSKDDIFKQNENCLSCHEDEKQAMWQASEHAANDVSCSSCHSVHKPEDPVLDDLMQAETCYSCHADQRANEHKRSKHPIKEGEVTCSSCHNPHGSGAEIAELVEPTVNETCANCHAEKRGPFLWEHAPVAEDCSNCHNPHGSVQPDLLKQRPPFLCQQCHNESHISDVFDGDDIEGKSNKVMGQSCMNCHSKVHGSNNPQKPTLF